MTKDIQVKAIFAAMQSMPDSRVLEVRTSSGIFYKKPKGRIVLNAEFLRIGRDVYIPYDSVDVIRVDR